MPSIGVAKLYEEYTRQKAAGEHAQFFTFAKIKYEEGKTEYFDGNFHSSYKLFEQYLSALSKYFGNRNPNYSKAGNNLAIVNAKKIIASRMPLIVSAYILDQNIWPKSNNLEKLQALLQKSGITNLDNISLGATEKSVIHQNAIAATIVHWPNKIGFSFAPEDTEVMLADLEAITDSDRLKYLKRIYVVGLSSYRRNFYANQTGNFETLARYSAKVAELTEAIDGGLRTSEYYLDRADYYQYSLYMTTNTEDFWEHFAQLELALDEYVDQEYNSSDSKRKKSLYLANSLTHALRLSVKLNEKIDISKRVVDLYDDAQSYNTVRFNVYLQWFETAKKFLALNIRSMDMDKAKTLLSETIVLEAMKYEDRDHEYMMATNPEILETQKKLVYVVRFLVNLTTAGTEVKILRVPTLDAAIVLYREELIDIPSAFEILKRYIEKEVSNSVSPEPLRLAPPDTEHENIYKKYLDAGESDTIEFKQSWWYDARIKGRNDDVRQSALKALASLMNTSGGHLFVGIHDTGKITGLETADFLLLKGDKQKQLDEMRKLIDNTVSEYIGTSFNAFLKISFDAIDQCTYAIIAVRKANSPAWLYSKGKEDAKFYIRASASSRELIGSDLSNYLASKPAQEQYEQKAK